VAKQRGRTSTQSRRRDRKGQGGGGRRKSCQFCRDKVDIVDYKDFGALRRAMSEKGKIRSARITGNCRRHQRQLAIAIKRARELGLLPYVSDR
jgi:small subunit ribosomal protein S18